VQFRVIGPDIKKVKDIANQVREVMRANDQVIDPHLDWNEQAPYLNLVVDQDRVRAMGLTPQDISQSLSMLISGLPITTVLDGI
jgi:multidrug efflux pump